jgi:DNA invertase Pin-like site-specific DNA recombinase
MATKAYSYIRFSTDEQAKGHSLERQIDLSKNYASENNLELDTSLNMKDLGVSAYKGENATSGALASFINAIESGKVAKGSYLLVESLDRLSREKVITALNKFLNILQAGITIVTLCDEKKYEQKTVNEIDLIISLTIMSRAHEESKIKGQRIIAAWNAKRKNITKQKLTKWSPKWLYLSDDRTEFHIHQDRADIVKEIFEWSSSGLGITLIIQKLEKRGIEPWGSVKPSEPIRRHSKRWHSSYIQRILSNRTVLGEYKLRNNDVSNGHEIIHNYFPTIISDELFYAVQAALKERSVRVTGRGAGRKGKTVSNLFSGLAYCGYSTDNNVGNHRCDGNNERMSYSNKGNHLTYLQCAKIKSGNSGCKTCRKMWRYDSFETSFLTHINDIDISTLVGSKSELQNKIDTINNTINVTLGNLNEINIELEKITNALNDYEKIPELIIQRGIKLESEQKDLNERLLTLQIEQRKALSGQNKNLEVKEQLQQLISLMKTKHGDALFNLRLQLSELLKKTIDKILVYSNSRVTNLELIRLKLGDEAAEILEKNEKQQPKSTLAIFDVYYKSGKRRTVVTDRENPTKMFSILDFDNEKLVEAITSFNSKSIKKKYH